VLKPFTWGGANTVVSRFYPTMLRLFGQVMRGPAILCQAPFFRRSCPVWWPCMSQTLRCWIGGRMGLLWQAGYLLELTMPPTACYGPCAGYLAHPPGLHLPKSMQSVSWPNGHIPSGFSDRAGHPL